MDLPQCPACGADLTRPHSIEKSYSTRGSMVAMGHIDAADEGIGNRDIEKPVEEWSYVEDLEGDHGYEVDDSNIQCAKCLHELYQYLADLGMDGI